MNSIQPVNQNIMRTPIFTDEKAFTVEEHFNVQNDRIYAKSREEMSEPAKRVLRSHHPTSVMVWVGVSSQDLTKLHFVDPSVKVRAKNYLKDILEPAVKPLNQSVFKGHRWTFQQDSAPAHKAKITQNWLQKEVPDLISYLEWHASSPDLNPLDYKIWSKLEEMACSRSHTSPKAISGQSVGKFPDRRSACRYFWVETEASGLC